MKTLSITFGVVLSAAFGLAIGGGPAFADQNDPGLPALFDALASPAGSAAEAAAVQDEIERAWFAAPETGVALVFDRAVLALNDRDPSLAVVLTDHLTGLAPSFAEGWVLAGHAHSAANQPQDAARAYAEATRLEPRHFTALTRLGDLAVEAGDEEAALRRYRAALLINPHLDAVRARADALRDGAARREI